MVLLQRIPGDTERCGGVGGSTLDCRGGGRTAAILFGSHATRRRWPASSVGVMATDRRASSAFAIRASVDSSGRTLRFSMREITAWLVPTNDGVTIDELIAAVNHALSGCR